MNKVRFPINFPQLETKRLVLRELTPGDSEALFKNYSDEDISSNFMDEPFTNVGQAEKLIEAFNLEFEQGKAITWAISLIGTETCIGTCGYMIDTSFNAELGYDLSKSLWGNGLMNEALLSIVNYGFECLDFRKIFADTLSSNSRSINLLKKLEFQLDDVRDNSHYFSLTKKGMEQAEK